MTEHFEIFHEKFDDFFECLESFKGCSGAFRTSKNMILEPLGPPRKFRNLTENDQKMTDMITTILKFSMLAHVWRGAPGHYSFYIHIDS